MAERKWSAGRKLDARLLTALGVEFECRNVSNERASLWRVHRYQHGTSSRSIAPSYSTDLGDCGWLIRDMRERGLFVSVIDERGDSGEDQYRVFFQTRAVLQGEAVATTIPHAVTLAALYALERTARLERLAVSPVEAVEGPTRTDTPSLRPTEGHTP